MTMTKLKTFSERLNASLDKLGFPPKHSGRIQQLAEMTGLSHRGAGKWVSGESKPPAGKFSILAEQLQVNERWLRTGEGPMSEDASSLNLLAPLGITQDVPVYPLSQLHKEISHTITCILPYTSEFYGIVLSSEAMSPRFPMGSILILDALAVTRDGDFVLAADPLYPEPVFRQLLITNDMLHLHAHNPKFERSVLVSVSNILGKLVQAIVSFENNLY
jgi:SOS-response transcriptional repressor LexA